MADSERRAADGRPVGERATNGGNRGFAGAIEQARQTAPDGATEGDIQDVAFVVWKRDREAADVWEAVAE